MPKRKKSKVAAAPPLKPQGQAGGSKRTPRHIADAAAGNETYEVERVQGRCGDIESDDDELGW